MSSWSPLSLTGFVLAGGRSSRMGRDKALLELGGKPLLEHALLKLRRICVEVAVLSNNRDLARFAPVVADLHPGCGPMGGLEAALACARTDWSLVLPVDVPFVPSALVRMWAQATMGHGSRDGTRVSMFAVDGQPQPALLMLHRELAPFLTVALAEGRYKLLPVLIRGCQELARVSGRRVEQVLRQWDWTAQSSFVAEAGDPPGPAWTVPTPTQQAAAACYFSNLNTPEDFAAAEQRLDVLDTR